MFSIPSFFVSVSNGFKPFFENIPLFLHVVKLNLFPLAYCAGEEGRDSEESSSEKGRTEVRYSCKPFLSQEGGKETAVGVAIGLDVYHPNGEQGSVAFVYKTPAVEALPPTLATPFVAKFLVNAIEKNSHSLWAGWYIPIYVGAAFAVGGFYIGATYFTKWVNSMHKTAEDVQRNHPGITVEIIQSGNVEKIDMDAGVQFLTEAAALLRRESESAGERGPASAAIEAGDADNELMAALDEAYSNPSGIDQESWHQRLSQTLKKKYSDLQSLPEVDGEYLQLVHQESQSFDLYLSPGTSATENMLSNRLPRAEEPSRPEEPPTSPPESILEEIPSRETGESTRALASKDSDSMFGDSPHAFSPLEAPGYGAAPLADIVIPCMLVILSVSFLAQLAVRYSLFSPESKSFIPLFVRRFSLYKRFRSHYDKLTPQQLDGLRSVYLLLSLYSSGGLFILLILAWRAVKVFLNVLERDSSS